MESSKVSGKSQQILYGYGGVKAAEKSNIAITCRKSTEYRKISP